MLHTKAQGHWPAGSNFTLYGDEGHLGHVTRHMNKPSSPSLVCLHMKLAWRSGYRGEIIENIDR